MRNEDRIADVPKVMTPTQNSTTPSTTPSAATGTDASQRRIRPAACLLPVLALTLGPMFAGCGSEATDPGANVSDVPTSSSPTPAEDPNVAAAIADLAERQGVRSAEITVVSNDKVTWRDGSLGCPEPGKMYAMVLTDGVRVVLEAAGKTYEYHGGETGPVRFCEDPQEPVPGDKRSDAPQ